MTEICIKPIDDGTAKLVDCKTKKEVDICEVIANRCGLGKGRAKGKRAPSKYNIFMKDCLKSKTGPIQQRFKECAAKYKAGK